MAQRSGVSISTASRALSGSDRISAQTAARVRAAATALGYRPNANARALRIARAQFVGLVVTNLVNASFVAIAEIVQQAVSAQGFPLMLSVTGGEPAAERSAMHALIDHSAAGVIVVGSDSVATDELRRVGVPTVHLARRPDKPAGDCVLGDELGGGRAATEHLIELGHRRIGVIAGPQDVLSGRERLQGHWLAMRTAGIAADDGLIQTVPFVPDAGVTAVKALMALPARRRPTALVISNHEAALGALPALQERDVCIPDELSVVCVEDSQLARWWHPAITVVDNNARQMGALAARLLLQRIASPEPVVVPEHEYRVGARLIERSSTQARGRRRTGETKLFPA